MISSQRVLEHSATAGFHQPFSLTEIQSLQSVTIAMRKSEQNDGDETEFLRATWKKLYASTLPSLARTKDSAQRKWPVTLDHCFARIILDNTIGKGAGKNGEDVQWDKVLSKPAVKNMNAVQLRRAIELGERIWSGEVDLVELDRASLDCRGKREGKYKDEDKSSEKENLEDSEKERKRTRKDEIESPTKRRKSDDGKKQSTLAFALSSGKEEEQLPSPATSESNNENKGKTAIKNSRSKLEQDLNTTSQLSRDQVITTLKRIQTHSGLTPFRQRLYISLLSVPRGKYTTYAAMAKHLDSVARAVGNGMRHNPFAPEVPCHRVLASDGTIGGFCGDWGRDGKNTALQNKKIAMLGEEGVKFDSAGKVKGPVWREFWDLRDFEKEYGKTM